MTKARNGQFVQIDDDVQGIANGLADIDPHIRLRYSEAGEHYVIYWTSNPTVTDEDLDQLDEGQVKTYLIFTAQDLDHRIVHHMQEVYWRCRQPGYSFADELERTEKEQKAQMDHEWTEEHGEMAERMAHAMRKDLGYNQAKVFVPESI